jgi:ketosteroid isomerase-like protein
MSRENVELLRRGYEAFNDGDVDPFLALFDERFVYTTRGELPGGGSFEGVASFRDRILALNDIFDEVRCEPQELIDVGERVVVVLRWIARGRASGVDLEESLCHVWTIRDGLAVELQVYSEREKALEAVGMRG